MKKSDMQNLQFGEIGQTTPEQVEMLRRIAERRSCFDQWCEDATEELFGIMYDFPPGELRFWSAVSFEADTGLKKGNLRDLNIPELWQSITGNLTRRLFADHPFVLMAAPFMPATLNAESEERNWRLRVGMVGRFPVKTNLLSKFVVRELKPFLRLTSKPEKSRITMEMFPFNTLNIDEVVDENFARMQKLGDPRLAEYRDEISEYYLNHWEDEFVVFDTVRFGTYARSLHAFVDPTKSELSS